tara:strand:+ start:3442 stop:4218 length:777 start_codon:yes stop_codon:yes gene_type:complete
MKILVCIKQVPDTTAKISIKADKQGVETNGIKWVMNPYDEFAVEEAIKLKEANAGSTLSVITVGPKARAVEALRTALAMGADDAIMVDAEENVDNLCTAKALAAAIEKEGPFDMVFTGKLAIDDQQSAVTQMLSELCGIPHANVVSKYTFANGNSEVEREIEGGAKEVLELKGKSVIGANKGLNTPRYASLPGIMKAKKKPVKDYSLADLGVDAQQSKVSYKEFSLPPERPAVKMIEGEPAGQTASLVSLLKDEAKVL